MGPRRKEEFHHNKHAWRKDQMMLQKIKQQFFFLHGLYIEGLDKRKSNTLFQKDYLSVWTRLNMGLSHLGLKKSVVLYSTHW